jgi:hypothetical protein
MRERAMRQSYFIHGWNGNESAEHSDIIAECGLWFGISTHATPYLSPYSYRIKTKTRSEAEAIVRQLEAANA